MGMSLDKAESTFHVAAWKLESPGRTIHILVMVDHMRDAPKEQDRGSDLDLYRSEFGTGYVACGNMCEAEGGKKFTEPPLMVLSYKSTLFHPPEFIPGEAMGTELLRRCPACKNCKECQFQMDSLSFKENSEYEIIRSSRKPTG